ncbi:MAG TPA: helix-turn-helix domain-containing protein [Acidimicrobiales bacterium]
MASPEGRGKVGRPPRISRQAIAEAAHELGLDGLTLRDVADHLGVSIAALYHHVSGKDDLMRLAAEYTAARVPRPADRGQHWAVWLYEWAVYNFDAFVSQPGLLAQYLDGAISAEAIADNVDTILGVLVRQGFSPLAANEAYELVTSCALGLAVTAIRERRAEADGRPTAEAFRQLLAGRDPGELVHLRRLLDEVAAAGRAPFHARIATVLRGIALEHDQDWEPIAALLDEAAAALPAPA